MNVAEYGQELKGLGLTHLQALAQLEEARRQGNWEMQNAQNIADSQATGALAGAVLGGAKGFYDKRKRTHLAGQLDKQSEWETEAMVRRIRGEAVDETTRPKVEDYSFLDDINDLYDGFWK